MSSLQWGRGFSSADTGWNRPSSSVMATLQWGRGFSSADTGGPERVGDGYWRLQWGRGFSSADTGAPPATGSGRDRLQWGRGFSSADTRVLRAGVRRPVGFNGAADFHPRIRLLGISIDETHMASMGPRIFIRGYRLTVPGRRSTRALQWGRGFSSADTPQDRRGLRRTHASMGPRIFIRGYAAGPGRVRLG